MTSGPFLILVVVERAVRVVRYASDGVALTEPEELPWKVWVESVLPDGRRVRIILVSTLEVGVGTGVSRRGFYVHNKRHEHQEHQAPQNCEDLYLQFHDYSSLTCCHGLELPNRGRPGILLAARFPLRTLHFLNSLSGTLFG